MIKRVQFEQKPNRTVGSLSYIFAVKVSSIQFHIWESFYAAPVEVGKQFGFKVCVSLRERSEVRVKLDIRPLD